MKIKLLIVVFVLRWTTQEAVRNPFTNWSYVDGTSPSDGCHIEDKKHEERFNDELEARSAMASMETNGLKPELFKVIEEPVK